MVFRNYQSPARLLSELQGVRLVNATSQAESSEGDLTIERHCVSDGPHPRILSTTGTGLFPLKQELPVWKAMWDSRPSWLRLLKCQGSGDRTILETIVNVATSMPFIAIGLQAPRLFPDSFWMFALWVLRHVIPGLRLSGSTKPAAKLYADSLVGVGVASTLYHVSRGEARKIFRFGDYCMIAVASLCLNSAIRDDRSRAFMLASALLIPIQPTLVSVLHTGMIEATFFQRVKTEPKLKRAHSLHKLSSVLGGVLFVVDDIMPQTPYIHAAWHLAASLGVATCTKLLE